MSYLSDLFNTTGADWMDHPERNCAKGNPDDWFPASEIADTRGGKSQRSRDQIRAARALCHGCPVANECLTFALENDERHGIWSGTTPRQRQDMLNRQAAS